MRHLPTYQPKAARRPHLFPAWVRLTALVAFSVPALYFGIKTFFGMMPVLDAALRSHGLIP